jgi:hypothetical protein
MNRCRNLTVTNIGIAAKLVITLGTVGQRRRIKIRIRGRRKIKIERGKGKGADELNMVEEQIAFVANEEYSQLSHDPYPSAGASSMAPKP